METHLEKMEHLRVTPDKVIEFPMLLYTAIPIVLKLENISATMDNITFKVKTTAPKKYLVRPSCGTIKPNCQCEILVTLQPLSDENETCGDRFLIQYALTDNQQEISRDFWTNIDKSYVFDKRLTVAITKKPASNTPNNLNFNSGAGPLLPANSGISQQPAGAHNINPVNGTAPSNINSVNTIPARQSLEFDDTNNIVNDNNIAAMNGTCVSSINQNDASLKQKYDELVRYCLAVEKQKNIIQKDNDMLKLQVKKNVRSLFDVWHILPLLIAAVIIAKIFGFL